MVGGNTITERPPTLRDPSRSPGAPQRYHISLTGAVQGVGFRPFVYRLAHECHLKGWVENSSLGVQIEVEGPRDLLDRFVTLLRQQAPAPARIRRLDCTPLDTLGYGAFDIRPSRQRGPRDATIMPDMATCEACLEDIRDPANRRYRYPFTNCTHCGPRFSIVTALPYDRANTTMGDFTMCVPCQAEYDDPMSRRFHAQANACPECGPWLELWAPDATVLETHEAAIEAAIREIKRGGIVALKGIGGFQLIVDATQEAAVQRLRRRKGRDAKPFALMAKSPAQADTFCAASALERQLLCSREAPIVLVRKTERSALAPGIAPDNPYVGVMLPYSPLHHLLLDGLDGAVVATSGNFSEEPILIDEVEALAHLRDLADLFLVHNRRIAHHVDDSVVRAISGREMLLRRARGYAPRPLDWPAGSPARLALGAHQKNTVAFARQDNLIVSPHIGDLDDLRAVETFDRTLAALTELYDLAPANVICDLHPDYRSSAKAHELVAEPVPIQHHLAHCFSCMVDNDCAPPLLGIAWDGTGYGQDGTVWGGEAFHIGATAAERVASLRPFRLPGGNRVAREPRRSAFGLLHGLFGGRLWEMALPDCLQDFSREALRGLARMCDTGTNSPWTSSVGRLFDGVSALLGLSALARFEGEAAMALEFAAERGQTRERYPCRFLCDEGGLEGDRVPLARLDWRPLITAILAEKQGGVPIPIIAAKFHHWLAEAVVQIADRVGETAVILSGGCFQNRRLSELTIAALRERDRTPYWHRAIPPNDGGIAVGQIAAADYFVPWKED